MNGNSGKLKLKTGTLASPSGWEPVRLARAVSVTASSTFEGQPDPQSSAQRTLHQAMQNRLIGTANLYHFVRDYALRAAWGYEPAGLPELTVTLALDTASPGPKFAIVIKSAQWSTSQSERLCEAGWHVLVFDSQVVVQAPGDVVDTILAVLHHVAGLPIGTSELTENLIPSDADDHRQPAVREQSTASSTAHFAKRPVPLPQKSRRTWRLPVLVACAAMLLSGYGWSKFREKAPNKSPGLGALSLTTTVKDVQMTKEGHAVVTLSDGRHTFVSANSVRHNPNMLHDLIVAWRQGKSLNVFTTNHQQTRYGREIGIKSAASPKPAQKPSPKPTGH
ncbi:MAG: hypothetical protein H7338_23685 [Candidatus Sericytochromatia bacterium]|nr:hypothetical protein [Candidatus Sericytochromatia bacterium]